MLQEHQLCSQDAFENYAAENTYAQAVFLSLRHNP